MAVLADLERLFERVFERSTARLFRAHPQAVQLERRVERAMERARVTTGGRATVPARYRVRLHPDDLAGVAAAEGGPEALAGRLADAALSFARAHGYHLAGRPSVALVADPAVQGGVIEVDAVPTAGRPGTAAHAAPGPVSVPAPVAMAVPDVPVIGARPVLPAVLDAALVELAPEPAPPDHAGAAARAVAPGARAVAPGARAVPPAPAVDEAPAAAPPVGHDLAATPSGSIRGDGTHTLVFRRPAPAPTRAVLRIVARDGSEQTVEVDGNPLTLGRAADNALVIPDPRVSRHHARLQSRRGTLVFTDLGSTNGSRLNGVRVDECALGTGDRVVIGDTVLLVEQLPG